MSNDERGEADKRRRKCYMLAKRYKLSRADRLELSQVLLWRDVESWSELTDAEVIRVLDAFEGFALINHLMTR